MSSIVGQIFVNLLNPICFFLVLVGGVLGTVLGAIPGLSGGLAIAVFLPATFFMKAELSIPFLMAIYVGSMSGSYIGAILLGIPGTPSSIATVYDGYQFTKKGDAVHALSVVTVCNFLGTIPSILIAMFFSPLLAKWALKLGPWEFFSLSFCAVMMVISLSKGNITKGLLSAGIAFLVSSVGTAPLCGTQRFTFGSYYLSSGFSITSVMLGLFAGITILMEYAKQGEVAKVKQKVGHFKYYKRDFVHNRKNMFRSFLIGLWVGFLPGLGGSVSNQMAYAMEKNASKTPDQFGKGCIDGCIASETANNASLGGALIPFLALGIPGDMVTSLLLGALTIQGVQAGPLVFRNSPKVVYLIFGACLMTAIFVFLFEIIGMPIFPKILSLSSHVLYPAILVVAICGAYTSSSNIFAVVMVLVFTALGLFMAFLELPVGPFMLAYVLSNVLETNFRKGISYAGNGAWSFFTRPISCILLLIAIGSVVYPCLKGIVLKKKVSV
ncbi:MAG: tripartite tricarboxylate transporter permease [Spirochaetia bacterium]|jgi:putative tricarboxylic transport membrane protein|nr:tripartite tricarboxylate transporter permease [Spirochaetia bacterium]